MAGCSATEEVARRATAIGALAQEDRQAWTELADAQPEASAAGVARADAIAGHVGGIHGAVTQIKDNSVWDRLGGLVETAMWAVIAAAACVVVVYVGSRTGVFAVIGGWLQLVTPAKRQEARLILDTLDEQKPEGVRELVANLRGRDPQLNRAIEIEKRRRQRRPAGGEPTEPQQEIRT